MFNIYFNKGSFVMDFRAAARQNTVFNTFYCVLIIAIHNTHSSCL